MAKKLGSPKKLKKQKKLNPKQEFFCQLYATEREFFGNGVESYIEAFDVKPNKYNSAKQCAYRLLTNVDILRRIEELLDITLNDAHVDKHLGLVITQCADLSSKVAAIREYNKLKKRVDDKATVKVEVSLADLFNKAQDNQ